MTFVPMCFAGEMPFPTTRVHDVRNRGQAANRRTVTQPTGGARDAVAAETRPDPADILVVPLQKRPH
jgi:hypothetical protein